MQDTTEQNNEVLNRDQALDMLLEAGVKDLEEAMEYLDGMEDSSTGVPRWKKRHVQMYLDR